MKRGSLGTKRAKGYFIAAVITFAVTLIATNAYLRHNAATAISPTGTRFERVEVKVISVTKSTHTYFVTINFVNTGLTNTSIESLLLNGIPYDDLGWTGTVKPVVFGDIKPETVLEVGSSYCGIVIFSDDCKDPTGKQLVVAGESSHYVNIGFHTTGGKDYDTFVFLSWNCYPETSPCPASTLATAMVAVIALVALFIMVRRRALAKKIKGQVMSV